MIKFKLLFEPDRIQSNSGHESAVVFSPSDIRCPFGCAV